MPDGDWVLYKKLRGRPLPQEIKFRGTRYALDKVFKQDFYAATGAYRQIPETRDPSSPECLVLKIYHLDPLWFLPLRWLGRWLWRREMHFGKALAKVPGVVHVLGRHGKSGLIREYIPGQNLREFLAHHQPDGQFFSRLKKILAAIHALGITHNDLSKPENILVRLDGTPVLLDFQIAFQGWKRLALGRWLSRPMVNYLKKADRFHVLKHHRRTRPQDFTPAELQAACKKGILLTMHGWVRRPYRAIRHFILRNFLMAKKPTV